MAKYFCISVTFLNDLFHGKLSDEEPEWPPSPWRLFQALVAGTLTGCRKNGWPDKRADALRWLERKQPPQIIAPEVIKSTPYALFVPNNDSDKEFEREKRLTSKLVRPHRMVKGQTVHYIWELSGEELASNREYVDVLIQVARHIIALGWGIDQVACSGCVLDEENAILKEGILWTPHTGIQISQKMRRVPIEGSLDDLLDCYGKFCQSVRKFYLSRKEPTAFQEVAYLTIRDNLPRAYVYFELRSNDGSRFTVFRQVDTVKVAAMVRHLACEEAKRDSHQFPGGADRYVAGHANNGGDNFPRFSYLPLPTVGHPNADGMIRRVVIAEPIGGNGGHAQWAKRRLHARSLVEKGTNKKLAILYSAENNRVLQQYLGPSRHWSSVTPVILPGFDDGKYGKAERLLLKAIKQVGLHLEKIEDFFLRKAPFWPGSQHPCQYYRPDYLCNYSAWHVYLRFKDELHGPLALGPGRHCGLGLFTSENLD
ncbi:MAG: type I-U CRISPR-associated protein Cas5/Cas6 [Acidobacteria bacterium]|jgi:CRISPR-associated protein Csb2|nr:MAG: type I-U CRISPR-associated protein Cas5/Cas6 [Acidobacteriota bacterium]GIU81982.1 MAG: type I-U CRISPR-associated protein Cas5/Cas6 [Pyrinomonadaceae bacterium]